MGDTVSDRRAEIDAIDAELLRLLNLRAQSALRVGDAKRRDASPLYDPHREREVLLNVRRHNAGPLDDDAVANVFGRVIDECRRVQGRVVKGSGEGGAKAKPLWDRVTVVGCGLIGASFALALRECGACRVLAGWDSDPAVLEEALGWRVIDEVDRSFAAREVSSSDLIYLAAPVSGIVAFLREHGPSLKSGATVTDAGSTKVEVCRAAREHLPEGVLFVGGHPVAGSHHAGLAHARSDLFRGVPYVLTGDFKDADRRPAAVEETVAAIGARVEWMSDSDHDRALALVSHLPQLLSSALAATVKARADAASLLALAGTGYRDMTRLADCPWQIWRDILATNPAPVAEAIGAVVERLEELRGELEGRARGGGADELPFARALFERARGR